MPKTIRFGMVEGIANLSVRFEGAIETKKLLAQLPKNVQRKVLRNAVAASARPVTKTIKSHIKSIAAHSPTRESTGAAARAITQTVKTSKKDPAIAYAMIGARRGYFERVHLTSTGRRRTVLAITKHRTIGRGRDKRVTNTRLKNIGPSARRARLRPSNPRMKNGKMVGYKNIRRPTRYLHLLEKGRWKTPPKWPGWHVLYNTYKMQTTVRIAFATNMSAGIDREFQRLKSGKGPPVIVRAA